MSTAQDLGTAIEYAVQYDAPEPYAGVVARVGRERYLVESIARQENATFGFECHVVQREVTYGAWGDAS